MMQRDLSDVIPMTRVFRSRQPAAQDVSDVTLCARNCEAGAITIDRNLAHIDPEKCTNCGACKAKCPVKIIS